jgi:hypothetical protein
MENGSFLIILKLWIAQYIGPPGSQDSNGDCLSVGTQLTLISCALAA